MLASACLKVMNACVESEAEVAKVLQKEIIDGDPLDNACVFWQESVHPLLDVAIN